MVSNPDLQGACKPSNLLALPDTVARGSCSGNGTEKLPTEQVVANAD